MFKAISEKLQSEQVQRAVLQTGAAVVTIVVAQVVAGAVGKGLNLGIDKLMEKMHPNVEIPAE